MKRCTGKKNSPLPAGIILLLLLLCISASLLLGQYAGWLQDLKAGKSSAWTILVHIRLVRTLGSCLCGAALAMSGALIQIIFHNPLCSAGTLGINSGSGFFQCLFLVLFPAWSFAARAGIVFGVTVCALVCILASFRKDHSTLRIVLCGVIFSQIFSAGIDMLLVFKPEILQGYASFKAGSFSSLSLQRLTQAAVIMIPALIFPFFASRILQIIMLGADHARSCGVSLSVWHSVFLLCACILSGGSVYLCGLLGFAGLVVPALCRLLQPDGSKGYLLLCALCGALLVCFCDLAGRILFPPFEIPAGVLCALTGGPVFLVLLIRGRKKSHA